MADDTPNNGDGSFKEGPAADTPISLSQTLLAPLDSIFKAQAHAARSFLSLILQLGYEHKPLSAETGEDEAFDQGDSPMYSLDFQLDSRVEDGKEIVSNVKIPALAMLPVTPLAVDEAEFNLKFHVEHISRHQQMADSKASKLQQEGKKTTDSRPWFLVKDPVSMRGTVGRSDDPNTAQSKQASAVEIRIKVGKQPMPAAMDRLLTAMTEQIRVENIERGGSSTTSEDETG